MITWQYFDANMGIHAYRWDTEYYDITKITSKKMVLEYNENLGRSFEDDRNPYKIEFQLKNPTTTIPEDGGPNDGEPQFNGGSISGIRMYDTSGDMQIEVSGINIPLVAVQGWYNRQEEFDKVFDYLDGFAAEHIGASNGPESTWDLDVSWDDIRTGRADDTVKAKGGHDYIVDGGGSDSYDGGKGRDTLSYDDWFWNPGGALQGIDADLKSGKIVGPDGHTDTVKNIEKVKGTFLDDVLKGDKERNEFSGLAGNDEINGRDGWDRVRYDNDDNQGGYSGIRADMAKGKIRDGFGTTDTVKNIESVGGTDFRDVFVDAKGDYSYDGRDGDDKFKIAGGNDWMEGDDGADMFIFTGKNFGSNHIEDFDSGEGDRIEIVKAAKFNKLKISSEDNGNDTLIKYKTSEIYLEDVSSVDKGDFIF